MLKVWQVDAFTNKAFSGNPACVLILETDISDQLKQDIAMEMNLSETVFVVLNDKPSIRWFTPNSEVNLCGHATLAAAHILWSEGFIRTDAITLQSKSGLLGISRKENGYTLDFPAQTLIEKPEYKTFITDILKCTASYIGSNGFDCVAVIDDHNFLNSYQPNAELISLLPERGFILTTLDKTGNYDYLYRAFFPKLDIVEDPVTGSANTALAPYWSAFLNKKKLKAHQLSKRGGELNLSVENGRVLITGNAVTVMTAQLHLED